MPPLKLIAGMLLVFLVGVPLRADLNRLLGHAEVDIFTDTTVTAAGRARPAPTPAAPVYYKIIDRGETNFHSGWAGEQFPSKHTVRQWLKSALAKQGYVLADFQHPPTLLLVFAWGMTRDNAFYFLGGNKMPPPPPVVGPGGVWYVLISVTDVPGTYVGLVLAYTIESESAAKPTLLWMTRFGSPSPGFSLRESMPVMIEAAALNFGRETDKPAHLAVLRPPSGKVTFGDIKVLGEAKSLPPPGDKPGSDEPR